MTETDKALAVAGFVRFPTDKGPVMLRFRYIDLIVPADCGCSVVETVSGRYVITMAPADAQGRLADALREHGI